MNAIKNNPFKTLGLLVGASAVQQNRHITKLPFFIEADAQIPDEFTAYAFPVLGEPNLSLKNVAEAASKLNLYTDKLYAALFWFYNGNAITDEPAFDALKDRKIKDAVAIWGKLVQGKDITEKNASAFFNWANLFLFASFYKPELNLEHLEKGISLKLKFLESDHFHKFKTLVTDENYKTTKNELQLYFLKQIQQEIENVYGSNSNSLYEIVGNLDFAAKNEFLGGFTTKMINQLEDQVETAKKNRKSNPANGIKIGNKLIEQSDEPLTQIQTILGSSNLKYTTIADKVANEALQCSIDYFNHHKELESDLDYLEPTLLLAGIAKKIAIGSMTNNRISENIETLESMKENVLFQALEFLKSVKSAYEENENNINQHVRELEANDFEIRSGRKVIDYTAVKKRIQESINWKKVNESLISVLSDNNLKIIRESDKTEQRKEFLKLMTWLNGTSLECNPISKIINKYKEIPPKLPFKIISSELLNTDKDNNPLLVTNPMYIKYTRYVGIKLHVECYKTSYVTFNVVFTEIKNHLSSSIHGLNSLVRLLDEFNKKQDKIEFTRTLKIDPNTKFISLFGMGNDNECTFSMNEHTIRVYVDDFLLLTKQFVVTIAPSELIEMELERAEKNLEKIKETQFFQSELNVLNDQLELIKKWKFGRSLSDKESQLAEQRRKIKMLEAQAEIEKEKQLKDGLAHINKLKIEIQQSPY